MNSIAILNNGQQLTMSSLELVDFINEDRRERAHAIGAPFPSNGFPGLEHKNFLAKVMDVIGETSARFLADLPDGYGRPRRGYRFPKREACLMAMSYSYELQAKVFDRMTALETKPAELSRLDILQIAMEAEQGRLEAEKKLAIAAPKAEFVDKYVESNSGSMGIREVCKIIGTKQTEFVEFLLSRGFMYRTGPKNPLTPKADHIHNGRFVAKTGTADHGDSSHAYIHYKFSAKGVNWVAGEWGKKQMAEKLVALGMTNAQQELSIK